MRNGFLVRGVLALAAAVTLSTAGVLTLDSGVASAATPTITVTPDTGLQPTGSTTVSVTGSGFAASSAGSILECNNDASQPTVALGSPINASVPVSCTGVSGSGIISTDSSGGFTSSFSVVTGTTGPPCGPSYLVTSCPATDSSGGNPTTDAAKYPCPPTAAQQAAGDSCSLNFGDASGNTAMANISFAGACVAPQGARGYDMAAADGGVFTFGTLPFCGSAGGLKLNKPVVGMSVTRNGGGYWLVASDGGIFNYGNAGFFGSAGSLKLNQPIVGMATTPDAGGYWLVASDGGIFSYGDAVFHGSSGATPLNKPIDGTAATPDGGGYWLVASDGGIFNYGDAGFFGSAGGLPLVSPIASILPSVSGKGYLLVGTNGGVLTYGDATSDGSLGLVKLNQPIVAAAAVNPPV